MKAWIICISGFTETRGEHTGTTALWKQLRRHSSPQVCVQIRLWDEDWRDYAAFIAEHSEPGVRILVCAYSWGAGHGFIRLARYLQGHGIRVETAVLCDPVYRSRTLLGRWLAFVPWLPIRVPANVDDVFWLRQTGDVPAGHTPKATSPGTWIHPVVDLTGDYDHRTIDESANYHVLALREAARLLNKPPRREIDTRGNYAAPADEPKLHD